MSNPQDYTVGYICALSTESVACQAFLDERHPAPSEVAQNDNNSYVLGKTGNHNVVIAVLPDGEYGLVSAASVARDMLHTFSNIRLGLMVGIGGGAPSQQHDVRLGDVVVSSPRDKAGGVIQYDIGKAMQDQTFVETGFLNQPPTVLRSAVAGLRSIYESDGHSIEEDINEILQRKPRLRKKYSRPAADSDRLYKSDFAHSSSDGDCRQLCGDELSTLVLRRPRDKDEGEDDVTVHYGLIASANTLMKHAGIRDKLAAEKGVLCFEMEAAGLMNHFPCLVIRGICDYADSHKNKDWQGFAAMAAAAYAKNLLRQVPPNKVESEKRISEVLTSIQTDLLSIQKDSQIIKADTHAIRIDSETTRIDRWLSPADPSTNFNKARKARHVGTGAWFLQSDTFSLWERGLYRHLWIYGMSGCGKTILSATILDNLAQNDDSVNLFFFFDFTNTRKQKLDDMLRSLTYQLYASWPGSREYLDDLFKSCDGGKQPDTDNLSTCFRKMLHGPNKVLILLDALDECSDGNELLKWMEEFIPALAHVHLIATGRPEHQLERSLSAWIGKQRFFSLDKTLTNPDIRSYIHARLHQDQGFKRWSALPDTLEEINEIVSSKAEGSFRWAACQLDSLEQSLDREALEQALRTLPLDLNATYARILQSIPVERKEKAMRLLQFLAYSGRPLRLEEAIDVIAVRLDEGYFNPKDRLPCPEEIRGYCSSLVALIRAPGRKRAPEIQLAHFSVKEFLEMSNVAEFVPPSPMATITKTCLSYLGSLQAGNTSTIRSMFPLARFAAENWMDHAKHAESSESTQEAVVRYLQDKQKFLLWARLFDPEDPRRLEPGTTKALPLYFACLAGLEKVATKLVLAGQDVNTCRGRFSTALSAASAKGHEAIVRLLLNQGATINTNEDEDGGQSPALWEASYEGYERIVRLLLDWGANIDGGGAVRGSALYAASENGHEGVVRLLLDRGANVHIEIGGYGNRRSDSPLFAASASGHEAIVRLLLDRGADVNTDGLGSYRSSYGSALQAASGKGHEKAVRLLLARGADPNALGKSYHRYKSPLQAASESGHEAIVRLLLDHGSNVNFKCPNPDGFYDYGSAVTAALGEGHKAIVQLLLDRGAEIDDSDLQAAYRRADLDRQMYFI